MPCVRGALKGVLLRIRDDLIEQRLALLNGRRLFSLSTDHKQRCATGKQAFPENLWGKNE
jgi:hypothetical protein